MQGVPFGSGPDPAADREQQRRLVAQQRSEIGRLEARVEELERQLRQRTFWFWAAVIFAGPTSVTVALQVLVGDPFAYVPGHG